MGHAINGLIAAGSYLDALAEELSLSRPTRLKMGFRFLPLDGEDLDRLFPEPGSYDANFTYLSDALVTLLVDRSREEAVTYIETDYFGGLGSQSAVLALGGKLVFGPTRGDGTISATLKMMGVVKSETDFDEFDAVGLGSLRSNDHSDVPGSW